MQCIDLCYEEDILLRLQNNDPATEGLKQYGEDCIEGAGFAIGDSEHLRKVILDATECNSEHEVWHGISRNRSIEWLKLIMGYSDIDLHDDNILGLFIKYNCNLRCISFDEIEMDRPQTFNQLVALLSTCNNRRFECIEVSGIDGTDDQAAMFFNALNRHRRLLELALDGTNIGRTECTALANLLTNPASRIIKLRLEANDFDDYAITTFGNALRYRNTLVSLNFAGDLHEPSRITAVGCAPSFQFSLHARVL